MEMRDKSEEEELKIENKKNVGMIQDYEEDMDLIETKRRDISDFNKGRVVSLD